ncbi:hypothetical protein HPB52_001197 [Rhipicephalus sanguineus]|uniref:CCHC-type domain-containing protein n=1 Tax=Rhipicephalus sanguineus TaxID=34632 RepID=A0A9D4SX86_RHISA|nr:hypothetical protein HPB52_001197 [Rhipicephalus sanguineus]
MPEVEMVEGVEIDPEEANCPGWTTAVGRNKKAQPKTPKSTVSTENHTGGNGGRRTAAAQSAMKQLVKASRLPKMPRDHIRIIVRPRGGLDVKKVCTIRLAQAMAMAAALAPDEVGEDIVCPNAAQNILVVSTPMRKNACAYAAIQQIHLKEGVYDVAAYLAASDNTCKGVVRGVDADFSDAQLRTMIVNRRNPTALEVRRIKVLVVVLFEGMKVPNHVMCGSGMLPCTLYRRQVDVCYSCGDLGHRADVCPNPSKEKCRGCGLASPASDNQCTPECTICGGPHLTADRKCKQRFQLPYIVRQRRRRRRRAKKSQASQGDRSRDSSVSSATGRARSQSPSSRQRSLSRGRSRTRSKGRSHSRGPSRSKGRSQSRARTQEGPTWADRAKQNTDKGPKKAPTYAEVAALSAATTVPGPTPEDHASVSSLSPPARAQPYSTAPRPPRPMCYYCGVYRGHISLLSKAPTGRATRLRSRRTPRHPTNSYQQTTYRSSYHRSPSPYRPEWL